jgi:predicted nucleic acid-binding protein
VRLLAAELFVSEVTNVIWKHCHLAGAISPERARHALALTLSVAPTLVSAASLAAQALELALTFHRPSYDCFYLALAQQEHADLITADVTLVRQVRGTLGNVIPLAEWRDS